MTELSIIQEDDLELSVGRSSETTLSLRLYMKKTSN